MKTFLSAAITILLLSASCHGSGSRTTFLTHGPSAAAFGRGETGAAVFDDHAAAHYNPALIVNPESGGFYLAHFFLFDDSNYSCLALTQPLKNKTALGFSVVNLRSGTVELRETITDSPDIVRTDSRAFALSAAHTFRQFFGITAGATLRYVHLDMSRQAGGGIGMDMGGARRFTGPVIFGNKSTIDTGISAQNVLPPQITLSQDAETYSTVYRAGAAISIPAMLRALSYDTAAFFTDLKLEDSSLAYFCGIQYDFSGRYILRAGTYKGHYTLGAGYRYRDIKIDYAFDLAGYADFHRLGLAYYWSKAAQRPAISKKKARENNQFMKEARLAFIESEKQRKLRNGEINSLFKKAKSDYNRKRYLKATDGFEHIILTYPECKSAREYYAKITMAMEALAQDNTTSNYEELSYAKGYVHYYGKNAGDAINEWEKALQFNPKRDELNEYIAISKEYIKDMERQAKEKEAQRKAEEAFALGAAEFDNKNWVGCIKKMENVQEICKSEPFASSIEQTNKAEEYINMSVEQLSKTVERKQRRAAAAAEKEPEPETDTEGAEKKYKEGLVFYAQGKLFDATRSWEIALRLNPNHEKARKALDRVKK